MTPFYLVKESRQHATYMPRDPARVFGSSSRFFVSELSYGSFDQYDLYRVSVADKTC